MNLDKPLETPLSVDILRCIALHMADFGSHSAVTAALIHPTLTRLVLEHVRKTGVTACISEIEHLTTLTAQPLDWDGYRKIETLRINVGDGLMNECYIHLSQYRLKINSLEVQKFEFYGDGSEQGLIRWADATKATEPMRKVIQSAKQITSLEVPSAEDSLFFKRIPRSFEEMTLSNPQARHDLNGYTHPTIKVLYCFFYEAKGQHHSPFSSVDQRNRFSCFGKKSTDMKIIFVVMDSHSEPRPILKHVPEWGEKWKTNCKTPDCQRITPTFFYFSSPKPLK
jgi:hypothetical protein